MKSDRTEQHRPSWWWLAAASVAGIIGVGSVVMAVTHQRAADRPVGEGTLLLAESAASAEELSVMLADAVPLDDALRHLRNRLAILAVAYVDSEGTVIATTAAREAGGRLDSAVLLSGLGRGVFAAAATPLGAPLLIDGVQERDLGDVVYQAVYPVDDGGLVLHYDLRELLERRRQVVGLRRTTVELGAAGALFIVLAIVALIGRGRAEYRYREAALEANLLLSHTVELDARNRELDQARRAAERALALASEKSRIRSEFVLMIDHELRTPLTSVVTGSELLRSGTLVGSEREQLVEDLVDDALRLQKMIGQMLTVATLENRSLEYTLRPVALSEVSSGLRKLGLSAPPDASEEAYVSSDPLILGQLIGGLVENAYTHGARTVRVAYADAPPFEPMIEVGSRPDRAVFVVVEDDGPGIDLAYLPRMFEKFEKNGQRPGTGLGMYLSKVIVEALEGSLAVSTSPSGTAIAVAVPAADAPKEVTG